MRTTVKLIFSKGKTARKKFFNQELNKKKHEENAKRKNNYFIEKIATTPSTRKNQTKLKKFLDKKPKK
jgi:hypothetical protein